MDDQGNLAVIFDSQITITKDKINLTGRSNLLGGAILNVRSYQYGSESAYFKGDFQVDEHGDFKFEMDIDEKKLNSEPLIIKIGYEPETSDDIEAKEIYGKEGTHLKGPFKHKYTHLKETRYGVFAYAYLELTPDTTMTLTPYPTDPPSDFEDPLVWIKKDQIKVNETYYDITMKSNLAELTAITATITDTNTKAKSTTSVRPDGSFRFRIQRPNDKDVDDEDILINIEATSEGAFETEELYGAHGEKFVGELVKETKRGNKINYTLRIKEDK